MSNGNGHRWSKFWWQDYLNDQELKLCSLAAQGLWMRMLCVMHDNEGYLLIGGEPPTDAQLATVLGVHWREARKLLAELLRRQVCRKTPAGVLHSARMIRDFEASVRGQEFAEKRWNQPKNSPPPNGSPNGQPNSQAYRTPNARSLEAEEERTPRSPPEGGARRRNPRNAAGQMAREMDARIAAASTTIDAADVVEFNAFFQQRKGLANG